MHLSMSELFYRLNTVWLNKPFWWANKARFFCLIFAITFTPFPQPQSTFVLHVLQLWPRLVFVTRYGLERFGKVTWALCRQYTLQDTCKTSMWKVLFLELWKKDITWSGCDDGSELPSYPEALLAMVWSWTDQNVKRASEQWTHGWQKKIGESCRWSTEGMKRCWNC